MVCTVCTSCRVMLIMEHSPPHGLNQLNVRAAHSARCDPVRSPIPMPCPYMQAPP